MMVRVPGSPRTHVWGGLVLAIVGIAVGGYAYTGPRAYRVEFIFVALLGFLLLAGGSLLTGYGQANRPRMGKPKRSKRTGGRANPVKKDAGEERAEEKDPDGEAPERKDGGTEADAPVPEQPAEETSWTQRLRAWIPGLGQAEEVQATVACPVCEHVFEARGKVPFETTCPNCAHPGEVQAPEEIEMTTTAPLEPTEGKAAREQAAGGNAAGGKAATGEARTGEATGEGSKDDRMTATLACSHCEHVFTTSGTPPFQATCPNCAYTGRVDAHPS